MAWKKIGECAVDSGQLILVDPCYVLAQDKKNSTGEAYTYKQLLKDRSNEPHQEIVFSSIAGTGVVFSSGFGDGTYEVWAKTKKFKDWGERITEVKIKLI